MTEEVEKILDDLGRELSDIGENIKVTIDELATAFHATFQTALQEAAESLKQNFICLLPSNDDWVVWKNQTNLEGHYMTHKKARIRKKYYNRVLRRARKVERHGKK